jgi:hypothetical protein
MNTMTVPTQTDRPGLLRRTLLADSIVSGSAALLLAVGAGPLHDAFGLSVTFLRVVGVSLLPWTALLFYAASRATAPRRLVWGIAGVNLLWVAGSVLLLVSGWIDPTGLGIAFVIAQALAVLAFAELQIVGLRRVRAV